MTDSGCRRGRVVAWAGAGVLLAGLLAGCTSGAAPAKESLSGSVTVLRSSTFGDSSQIGQACTTPTASVAAGDTITVKRGASDIIATTHLAAGRYVDVPDGVPASLAHVPLLSCRYDFRAKIDRADFYTVDIPGVGLANYSRADLAAKHWRIDVQVGP